MRNLVKCLEYCGFPYLSFSHDLYICIYNKSFS